MPQNFRYLRRWGLGLNLFTLLISLVVFAYMGYYSRFIADDYCYAAKLEQTSLPENLIWRYRNAPGGDRFTHPLFLELVVALGGWDGLRFLPAALIGIWLFGLTLWGHHLFRRSSLPSSSLGLLCCWLIFYALWQAPQRYQILYWPSSSIPHFAPLALLPLLLALLSRQAARPHPPSWQIHLLNALLCFLWGGFSEPPTAMLITAFTLALAFTFVDRRFANRRALLLWPLVGLSLAMLVMLLAPANATRMDAPPPLSLFLYRLVRFPLDFTWDSLVTQPLPSLLSLLGPLLLVVAFAEGAPRLSPPPSRMLLGAFLVLGIMYLLIAASFAPSIYGQSYPVARARFAARVILTLTLMIEGALLGMMLRRCQPLQKSLLPSLLLLLLAFYPLRASLKMWQSELPRYQQRAAAWDTRHARILAQIAKGEKEIVVEQLNSFEQVKELDSDPRHWVNRCAAAYYGVESIRALPNPP
ncbi:MAG: DUF6056 family protein [Anaerolineales bacterium]